jgi:SHS family lactate transporter-like MFS transporter
MFWIGVLPALLVFWIRSGVSESPVWLSRQQHLKDTKQKDRVSMLRIFQRDLIGVTIQCSILLGAFMFSYYSITFWYPTLLREAGLEPIKYLMAVNIGGIIGAAFWGRMSETRLGRRGSATAASLMAIILIPLFLAVSQPAIAVAAAFLMGLGGAGMWGIIPTYLTERFPTSARGVGPGFAYHAGAGLGAITPTLIGNMKDRGMTLSRSMAILIAGSCLTAIILLWIGPETRGRQLVAVDEK